MKKILNKRFLYIVLIVSFGFLLFLKYNPTYINDDKKILECKSKNDQVCYKNLIMETFDKNGLDKALDLVAKIYSQDSSFSSTCHDIGHLLGASTYNLFRSGKDFKINTKIAFCSYGFYHGFMEILASEGDTQKAQDFCRYVDDQISKETPDATLQCFHGIGHGWVNIHGDKKLYGDDLGIVKRGLSLCEQVAVNDSELSRCATGVFNGIAIFYDSGEYELKVNEKDPMWVCKKIDQKFQDACYISMNTLLYSITNQNFEAAVKYVEAIKDDNMAIHAMINLALPFSLLEMNQTDHSRSIAVCRSLQGRLIIPCFQGFAFSYMEHGEPGKEYVNAINFCKSNGLSKNEEAGCLSYIYTYLSQWYPADKALSICDKEGEYKKLCSDNLKTGLESL